MCITERKVQILMTIFGITLSAAVVWLIAAAVFAIIEAATLGLTTIWFAGGAVAAAISEELVPRAMEASHRCGRKTLVAAGGVAANS